MTTDPFFIHTHIVKQLVTPPSPGAIRVMENSACDIVARVFSYAPNPSLVFGCRDDLKYGTPLRYLLHTMQNTAPVLLRNTEPTIGSAELRGFEYQTTVTEVVVGSGSNLSSSLFAGLDIALLSMALGEKSWFVISGTYGQTLDVDQQPHDMIVEVTVDSVNPEIDLTPPLRHITKYLNFPASTVAVDSYGLVCPTYGATVECVVTEIHPFNRTFLPKRNLKFVVGGPESEAWVDTAVMSMHLKELSTIHVAASGSMFKVRLNGFQNVPPPTSFDALVAQIDEWKAKGNALFTQGHKKTAVCYSAALHIMGLYRVTFAGGDQVKESRLRSMEAVLEGNLTQSLLNNKQYSDALFHASRAIELDGSVCKYYFRRAKANRGLKRYNDATMDLGRALATLEERKESPENTEWKMIENERTELEIEKDSYN